MPYNNFTCIKYPILKASVYQVSIFVLFKVNEASCPGFFKNVHISPKEEEKRNYLSFIFYLTLNIIITIVIFNSSIFNILKIHFINALCHHALLVQASCYAIIVNPMVFFSNLHGQKNVTFATTTFASLWLISSSC